MAQQAALQGEEKALVAQLGRLHEQVAEAQRALARKGAETVRCMGAAYGGCRVAGWAGMVAGWARVGCRMGAYGCRCAASG